MKKITLIILGLSLITCKEHIESDPVPVGEMISPFIETIDSIYFDVEGFNEFNKDLGTIMTISNEREDLIFLLTFKNSDQIILFNNGTETTFVPKHIINNSDE